VKRRAPLVDDDAADLEAVVAERLDLAERRRTLVQVQVQVQVAQVQTSRADLGWARRLAPEQGQGAGGERRARRAASRRRGVPIVRGLAPSRLTPSPPSRRGAASAAAAAWSARSRSRQSAIQRATSASACTPPSGAVSIMFRPNIAANGGCVPPSSVNTSLTASSPPGTRHCHARWMSPWQVCAVSRWNMPDISTASRPLPKSACGSRRRAV
jgi:hypothetical protein